VQHALRAFTPRDQKAVRAAAETFRPNKDLDTAQVITELGKGEALVSFLEGNGTPSLVERVMIRPPTARMGPITAEERKAIMAASPLKGKYDTTIDSESAYEMLHKRLAESAAPAEAGSGGGVLDKLGSIVGTIFGTNTPRGRLSTGQVIARSVTRSVTNKVAGDVAASIGKSVGGSLGGSIGRSIVRNTLGSLLRR
jgi:DNA helicase HerA-like ATPase